VGEGKKNLILILSISALILFFIIINFAWRFQNLKTPESKTTTTNAKIIVVNAEAVVTGTKSNYGYYYDTVVTLQNVGTEAARNVRVGYVTLETNPDGTFSSKTIWTEYGDIEASQVFVYRCNEIQSSIEVMYDGIKTIGNSLSTGL
jgi:hypothetical protein